MLTKQQLQEMKEDPLTIEVIIPVLRAMGYKDVLKHHGGSGELGKDIVCWTTDELGCRVNIAVVGKAVPITGAVGIATEVAGQIMQSFGASFRDKATGEEQYVGKCYVITNREITKDARPAIQSIVSNMTRSVLANIRYIDGDELWEWYQKYLADQPLWQKIATVSQDLDDVDSHYRLEAHLTSTGTQITTMEKYPGASADKPLHIKFTTLIPTDTEEGHDLAERIEQFIASGVPVKVPLSYIKDLEFPEFIKQALPEFTEDGFFVLGPAHNPKTLLLRFEFSNDDGEQFTLEYVQLNVVHAGKEEITLTNDNQPLPITVTVVLRSNGTISTQFGFRSTLNVHQVLLQLRLQHCLSKPYSVQLINLETGMSIAHAQHATGKPDAPPLWLLQTTEALHALQLKARKPITIPDRELTDDEWQMLDQLRCIVHEGKIEGTWDHVSPTVSILPEDLPGAKQLIAPFEEGKSSDLTLYLEETVSLFNVDLPLGKIKPIHIQAKLMNEQEVKEKLAEQKESEIQLKFVPSGDSTIVKEYLDWVTNAGETT